MEEAVASTNEEEGLRLPSHPATLLALQNLSDALNHAIQAAGIGARAGHRSEPCTARQCKFTHTVSTSSSETYNKLRNENRIFQYCLNSNSTYPKNGRSSELWSQ